MFTKLLSGLKVGRLASQCRVCHAWPADTVCEACVRQFAQPVPRCRTCARPLPAANPVCGACLKHPSALDRCLCAVDYSYPWDNQVQHFKFHAEPSLVHSLAALMRAAPWVEDAIEAADLLLPMPLSSQRLKERGYNQALLLARQLAPRKTRHDLLLKVHDTPPQHSLKRAARLVALDHAFAVEPLRAHLLCGKRVLLVDDVMTTGASLFTAARVLKAAGAGQVTGLVFARTV
ncbi:MAG: ComF family protein [Rhodoferax sp.]|nr:ComF family protein [Rhodoferax sp.]